MEQLPLYQIKERAKNAKVKGLEYLFDDILERCENIQIMLLNPSAFEKNFLGGTDKDKRIISTDCWRTPEKILMVLSDLFSHLKESQETLLFFPKFSEYFVMDYMEKRREKCRNLIPFSIIGQMSKEGEKYVNLNIAMKTLLRKNGFSTVDWNRIDYIPLSNLHMGQIAIHGTDFENWSKTNSISRFFRLKDEESINTMKKYLDHPWIQSFYEFYGIER